MTNGKTNERTIAEKNKSDFGHVTILEGNSVVCIDFSEEKIAELDLILRGYRKKQTKRMANRTIQLWEKRR